MAHVFLQSFDPNITVCSAGTEASGKLNPKAVAVMKEAGIDISHHTSDPVEKTQNAESKADFIHNKDCSKRSRRNRILAGAL
jgi:protein-tyrosine-phosphatase